MTDFLLSWDPELLRADWSMAGPDLAMDDTLRSAVIISLFTDRLAAADDVIPDGTTDRRGWWADAAPQNATQGTPGKQDLIGSRLWLLGRAKATPRTAARARLYCQEALAWLIEDGVAASVTVTTNWLDNVPPMLGIGIAIARAAAPGQAVNHHYDFVWSATMAPPPAPPTPPAPPRLFRLDYSRFDSSSELG